MKKKIVIINGPNLNLLGIREKHIYGKSDFCIFINKIKKKSIFSNFIIDYHQSNCEGEIINLLHFYGITHKSHGIILNAGAYTHTSIGIHDAIKAIFVPVIEIHISNIYARENFRKKSYISSVCKGSIFGFGLKSYELGIMSFLI